MYPSDLIEAVLKHADIVSVVSSYIPVTKKGRNHVALCPFHDDKNPSMQISSDKQIFKCFVCGSGGNAIGFVEKYEKIGFGAAVRKVASIAGYNDPRLVEEAPRAPKDPSYARQTDCINDLQTYYRYALTIPEGEAARNYLLGRDLDEATQKKYGIGYAPIDGKLTVKFLQAKGHSLKTIEDIGIALAHGEDTSDHNAGRVIFPLHDPRGQVVGFSARRIVDDGGPKYVNSPETNLFHKGNVLYNYHNAAVSSRHDGYCYVLEGFMDVMALDKAGLPNAVALMGTALTNAQITLLKRLNCEIRLCLDGDAPGQTAMMKACSLLQKAGVRFRLVDYGGDLRDPDDILREEGPDTLKAKMANLVEATDFQLAYYLHSRRLETAEERQKALRAFLPVLRAKKPGIEFEDMLIKLADATGFQPEAIRNLAREEPSSGGEEELGISVSELRVDPQSHLGMRRGILSRLTLAERTMVHYMLQNTEAIDYFEQNIGSFTSERVLSDIAEFLIEFHKSHPGQPELNAVLALVGESGIEDAERVNDALTGIAMERNAPKFSKKALDDCAKIIVEERHDLGTKISTQTAAESDDIEAGGLANKAYADLIKAKWSSRSAKKG